MRGFVKGVICPNLYFQSRVKYFTATIVDFSFLKGELRPDDLVENDVNERDSHGRTPIMWSASYGQSPTISLLIRHGADVRARYGFKDLNFNIF